MSTQAQPHEYAKAIYDLALETWTRQLRATQAALAKDQALQAAVTNPATDVHSRLATLSDAVPGGLSADVRRFFGTLLEGGQVDQLDAIVDEFERLARSAPERRQAVVTSAVPLTEPEQAALQARLFDRFGSDLEFEFVVDESLIGGIRLRIGDKVIDGSIAGKLAALRDRLAA